MPAPSKKGYVTSAELVAQTGLTRMSISRMAVAGKIPGAQRSSERGNWRFKNDEELSRWIRSEAVSAQFRKARPRYQRSSRKWEQIRAGEKHFVTYLKALEELIGKSAESREAYESTAKLLTFKMCELDWIEQRIERIHSAYEAVQKVAEPELFAD